MNKLEAGNQIGPYRIVRLLGEGGMGAVYEAKQEPIGRRVALKTLLATHIHDDEVTGRFFNEAKILSALEHPSIVQVSDYGYTADGTAYLVMEFLRGESLGKRLESVPNQKGLPTPFVLQIARQLADALSAAHEKGIVHRDLKPDNVMLVGDSAVPGGERVKVLDFGIAKLTGPEHHGAVKTSTQAVLGTPLYMSPEQCEGAGQVDAKTDVYSLGCVLFEALSGRPPFTADGIGRIIGMHQFQAPPLLRHTSPEVPQQVAQLVDRMLVKDRTLRPSMFAVAQELGDLLQTAGDGAAGIREQPQKDSTKDTEPELTRVLSPSVSSATSAPFSGQAAGARVERTWKVLLLLTGLLLLGGGLVFFGLRARDADFAQTNPTPSKSLPSSTESQAHTFQNKAETGLGNPHSTPKSTGHDAKSGEADLPVSSTQPGTERKTKRATNSGDAQPNENPPTKSHRRRKHAKKNFFED